ncbi:MAG: polyphosphate kinase 1 [Acidobacteriota bacterium]
MAINQETSSSTRMLPGTLSLQGKLLFNRELSWIEFNRRVLEEALDRRRPLLERLKFLAIFSTNLDEFFMIRVSALTQQAESEVTILSPDGMSPAEQLVEISKRLRPLIDQQMSILRDEVLPELERAGIRIIAYERLTPVERAEIDEYFHKNIFPVLTPLAVDPSHPFPYISNLSLNLAVLVAGPDDEEMPPRFARIKVPPVVPRLLPVSGSGPGHQFVLLEQVISANLSTLFPEMNVIACYPFRTTRNAEIEIEEDEASDLLKMIEQQLRQRRFGSCVRLEVDTSMPPVMVNYLRRALDLEETDFYTINGPLNVPDLLALYKLDYPTLKDPAFTPAIPSVLTTEENIFDILKRQDIMLHHPYDSFNPVVDFISAAAADPKVLAIKQTLYRTSGDSPIVSALIAASETGKQVAVIVELKARFDEENNIIWARKMERAGVHVVYGLLGVKTHGKVALVVRQEAGMIRRYVHLGTGNYNPTTAKVYTDIGILTCNPEIGADVSELFNYLTGYSHQRRYRKLLVAPINLRERMIELIERETEHHRSGRPARIIAKLNSLTDTKVIRALYEASQAGVSIDLIVRGICCLRPGLPGLSDTVRVISIVGRFLEHSRIFYFANGGQEELYLGSADWMQRNMDRRIEIVFPIEDERIKQRIKNEILEISLMDNMGARLLHPTGSYERLRPRDGEEGIDSQAIFLQMVPPPPRE